MNASRVFHVDSKKIISIVLWLNLFFFASLTHADDVSINITIQDHRFYPSQTKVPAGAKLKLVVTNLDRTPEEFESDQMKFEKIVQGGGRITVFVPPLKPGRYVFFGEFNLATAQGVIIAQ